MYACHSKSEDTEFSAVCMVLYIQGLALPIIWPLIYPGSCVCSKCKRTSEGDRLGWESSFCHLTISSDPLPMFHLQGCSRNCHILIYGLPPLCPRHRYLEKTSNPNWANSSSPWEIWEVRERERSDASGGWIHTTNIECCWSPHFQHMDHKSQGSQCARERRIIQAGRRGHKY